MLFLVIPTKPDLQLVLQVLVLASAVLQVLGQILVISLHFGLFFLVHAQLILEIVDLPIDNSQCVPETLIIARHAHEFLILQL